MARKNYVLIDYENVQPELTELLNHEHVHVLVFVGASQSKVSFELASSMQRLGGRAEYVKMSGNGANALDFHIAYYVGLLSSSEPTAYFHIISKDAGFDPLILHLKTRKIAATRCKSTADLPFLKGSGVGIPTDRLVTVLTKLEQLGTSKPRALKTLKGSINAMFQKSLGEEELSTVVDSLVKSGHVIVNGAKVSYSFGQ